MRILCAPVLARPDFRPPLPARRWTACLGLTLSLALAGCSGTEPDPGSPTPSTQTPTPETSPTSIPTPDDNGDDDGDGVPNADDNCADIPNTDQADIDFDGLGNECDPCTRDANNDADDDGICGNVDNCPTTANASQQDSDSDATGDACDTCPEVYDPAQADFDRNGVGDVCQRCLPFEENVDQDLDGVGDCQDLCPDTADALNLDTDGDGVGDACDNCPTVANAGQYDAAVEGTGTGDGVGEACASQPEFRLEEATVQSIHNALLSEGLTCEALVQQTLDRIHRYDLDISDGAPLNAVLEIDLEVLDQARALDLALAQTGELVGPLHCVPVLLKDNYDSTETTTTAGSLSLLGSQPPKDGFAVAGIRAAGALILGKAAMDELAFSVLGISGRSGKTGNAYQSDLNSGGSSAGTGVAVSASFAVMGTGTDNCASLRLPAAYNGLTSLRPSKGLISGNGIFPGTTDITGVGGPMARTLPDLVALLDAMVGTDPVDPGTSDPELVRPPSYTPFLDPSGLDGKRIGVLRLAGTQDIFRGASASTLVLYNRVLDDMKKQGATIIDNVLLPDFDGTNSGPGWVESVDNYLSSFDAPHESYLDMCESGLVNTECMAMAQTNPGIDSPQYADVLDRMATNRALLEGVMDDLSLDALIFPVDPVGGASTSGGGSTCTVSSFSGVPSMVLRAGYTLEAPAMPIGIEILARKYDEPTLIQIGYAYELSTGWRRAPVLTSAVAGDPSFPAMDIQKFNALHTAIGQAAFEAFMTDGKTNDLTAESFTPIVREQIEAAGMSYLLGN